MSLPRISDGTAPLGNNLIHLVLGFHYVNVRVCMRFVYFVWLESSSDGWYADIPLVHRSTDIFVYPRY